MAARTSFGGLGSHSDVLSVRRGTSHKAVRVPAIFSDFCLIFRAVNRESRVVRMWAQNFQIIDAWLTLPCGFGHLLPSLAITEARRNQLFMSMAIHHPARSRALSFTIESFEQ